MGIPFNDESDKWVTEICKCMREQNLHFGGAMDHLMAQKKAAISPSAPPKFSPDQNVVCPQCKATLKYRDWPDHRRQHG